MTVMLYKHPGKHKLHGDFFDHIIVDELDVESKLSEGWSINTADAKMSDEDKIKIAEEEIRKANEKLASLSKKEELTPAEKSKRTKAANKAKKEAELEEPNFE
jgi:hypothetical protein